MEDGRWEGGHGPVVVVAVVVVVGEIDSFSTTDARPFFGASTTNTLYYVT
jgi:hypothetical protein